MCHPKLQHEAMPEGLRMALYGPWLAVELECYEGDLSVQDRLQAALERLEMPNIRRPDENQRD